MTEYATARFTVYVGGVKQSCWSVNDGGPCRYRPVADHHDVSAWTMPNVKWARKRKVQRTRPRNYRARMGR